MNYIIKHLKLIKSQVKLMKIYICMLKYLKLSDFKLHKWRGLYSVLYTESLLTRRVPGTPAKILFVE